MIGAVIVIALLRQPALGRAGQERVGWRRVGAPPLPDAYRAVRSIRWLPRVLAGRRGPGGRRARLRREQRDRLGAHRGRRLRARRAERRAAHRHVGPALARPVRLRRHRRRRVGARHRPHRELRPRRGAAGWPPPPRSRRSSASRRSSCAAWDWPSRRSPSRWPPARGCCGWTSSWATGCSPRSRPGSGTRLELAKDYYLFALLMLALGLWVAGNLRRSGFGLSLQALRDNEDAARAFTVPSRRRKLQLYAVSGALAGLGGVVIGHSQTQLTVNSFPAAASIDVVALTVIGGLGVTSGPILGALHHRRAARRWSDSACPARPRWPWAGCSSWSSCPTGSAACWSAPATRWPTSRPAGPASTRSWRAAERRRRPPSPLHVRARLDGLVPDLGGAAVGRRTRARRDRTVPTLRRRRRGRRRRLRGARAARSSA